MRWNLQLNRSLEGRLPASDKRRLVVLSGARQVGKTTLVRARYPELRYINLDSPEDREAIRRIHSASWGSTVGPAVLDEAQKEPVAFEKIKYAFDERSLDFSVLLGSSRFLLLDSVRETLAGRAFVYELWPLMLGELVGEPPLFDGLLEALAPGGSVRGVLSGRPSALLGAESARRRDALNHLSYWGGMPELGFLDDDDRREWLRSYTRTFLERDLADLTRLSDLEPFRTLQQLVMLRTGQLLSHSELGRDAGIAATTARRYLEFLRISFQATLLQPYHQNLTSGVVKTPKVYWTDLGLLRSSTGQWELDGGALFETLVVGEAQKWIGTMGRDARLYFYRTRSGMELDLLVERGGALLGVEVKARERVVSKDLRSLRAVAAAAGERWRGGLVAYRGDELRCLDEEHDLWAMPAHRLF